MRSAERTADSGFLSPRSRVVCFTVRRLGWYVLRAAVAAIALGGTALLAANLYVQSHGVQQRIRAVVEDNLQVPVHLQKTTVTPWEGLRLDGITLRGEPGSADATPDFLTAASFRVRFAWWPLLTERRLVIERVLLDRPRLTWQQDGDGRWSFPPGRDRPPSPPAGELAQESLPAAPPPTGAPPADEHRADGAAKPPRLAGIALPISSLHIRHGKLDFLNRGHRPLVQVDELNSDGAITDAQHVHGSVCLDKVAVPSTGLALTNYHTAVDLGQREGLILHDGQGTLAGGSLRTDFRVQPRDGRPMFSTACHLDGVALGQLTALSHDRTPFAEGRFYGSLECRGSVDDPASRSGGGRLSLVGGRLRGSAPLKLLGQLLRISDLGRLEFKQADLQYKVDGTSVLIESLVLAANDVRIDAHGTYQTDEDQLDVHGRLTIDQAVSHQLPQFIESNFAPCGPEAAGCRSLDFDVTGPADDPKSNLYDRLTAGPMKGLLDNLLAPKSRNPKGQPRGGEPRLP